MNPRASLSLLLLLALVFNQVAASLHVVEHIAPAATPGLLSEHSDTHAHGLTFSPAGQHDHSSISHMDDEHVDSTVTCLFYHVLLATHCPLITNLPQVAPLPNEHGQSVTLKSSRYITTRESISIRGPPENS